MKNISCKVDAPQRAENNTANATKEDLNIEHDKRNKAFLSVKLTEQGK